MIKSNITRLILQIVVLFVIFCSVDYMLYSEFRFLRNSIISIPVSIFLFFMSRKQDKENNCG